MLRFDGFNPYNLPMEYLRLAANLMIWGWVTYQFGIVIWSIIKSFREARAYRRKRLAIEAEIMSEHIAEVARMNKARRIEASKWGFRDPVIIKNVGRRKGKYEKRNI